MYFIMQPSDIKTCLFFSHQIMVLLDCIDSLFIESAPRLIQSIGRDVRGMLCDVIMPLHAIFFKGLLPSASYYGHWKEIHLDQI